MFFGAWQVPALRVVTVLAVWGALIIGAVYMLRAVRAVMHGPAQDNRTYATDVTDANLWRKLPYAMLIASLVFGFFPKLLTEKIKPVTEQIVNMATVKPVNVRSSKSETSGKWLKANEPFFDVIGNLGGGTRPRGAAGGFVAAGGAQADARLRGGGGVGGFVS